MTYILKGVLLSLLFGIAIMTVRFIINTLQIAESFASNEELFWEPPLLLK